MPQFNYIAKSGSGEKKEGTVEAPDKRGALIKIERLGYVPVSVTEGVALRRGAAKSTKKKRVTFELHRNRTAKMGLHEVLLFSRELSDLIASGMTLGNALNTLANRDTGKTQDQIIGELRDEIVQGSSLSEALAKRPETFAPLYVSMVRAGEASGTFSETLESLCTHYERVQEAREKVMMALIYPSIVLAMGLATIIFCMVYVVPKFTSIFAELGSSLPLPTRILIGISDAFIHYGWFIVIALIFIGIGIHRTLKTPAGRRWWHHWQLKLPVIKNIVQANAFAHFSRTLRALLTNGVPVLQALTIVEDTVGNMVIAEEVGEARNKVTDGATISVPLAAGNVFPALLTDMLAVGEETGDMSGALVHIARRYDDELDRSVKILTTVIEPVLMLLMAVLVGFLAVSMLMAVFELTSGLES